MNDSLNYYVLLSGGVDSACLLAHYRPMTDTLAAIHVSYGHLAHREELSAARAFALHYGVPVRHIDVGKLSSVSSGEISGRNGMLLAIGHMIAAGRGVIGIGIHAGTPYADCSLDFVGAVQSVFDVTTNGSLRVDAPFVTMSKPEVYELAVAYGVPINLTWSCEREGPDPCLQCLSCKDRTAVVGT